MARWMGHHILPTSNDNSVLESASITPVVSNSLLGNAIQPLHPLWCVASLLVFRAFGRSRGGSSATVLNSRNLGSALEKGGRVFKLYRFEDIIVFAPVKITFDNAMVPKHPSKARPQRRLDRRHLRPLYT